MVKEGDSNDANPLDNPDEIYEESLYEHSDAITCIEKNFKDP